MASLPTGPISDPAFSHLANPTLSPVPDVPEDELPPTHGLLVVSPIKPPGTVGASAH